MSQLSKRSFGRHIRSLRKARGMTQEQLAEKSGVAVDTVRRLEAGSFSPSLDTLTKVVGSGMNLRLSTMFESCELGATERPREISDLLASRSPRDLDLASRVLRLLFDEIAARADAADSDAKDGAGESEAEHEDEDKDEDEADDPGTND